MLLLAVLIDGLLEFSVLVFLEHGVFIDVLFLAVLINALLEVFFEQGVHSPGNSAKPGNGLEFDNAV